MLVRGERSILLLRWKECAILLLKLPGRILRTLHRPSHKSVGRSGQWRSYTQACLAYWDTSDLTTLRSTGRTSERTMTMADLRQAGAAS